MGGLPQPLPHSRELFRGQTKEFEIVLIVHIYLCTCCRMSAAPILCLRWPPCFRAYVFSAYLHSGSSSVRKWHKFIHFLCNMHVFFVDANAHFFRCRRITLANK